MTYCWYWSMTCWEVVRVVVIISLWFSLKHNLRPDPPVGVNLQQQRVRQPAVDDVDLADAGPQALQARLHLRQHAAVDDARGHHFPAAGQVQAGDSRGRVAAVAEDAGDVG